MKQRIRSILMGAALCLTLLPIPAVSGAAGTIHILSDGKDLGALLEQSIVQDGDTIRLSGTGYVPDRQGDGAPWVIEKQVTIEGGTLVLEAGGMVLGADVVLDQVVLSCSNPVRSVLAANGYTLTLNGCRQAVQPVHLFCGTLLSSSGQIGSVVLPPPGEKGTIVVTGTGVELGNLYAGDLVTDAVTEDVIHTSGLAAEIIVSGTGRIGRAFADDSRQIGAGIYASGAVQATRTDCPPVPYPRIPATGGVTIHLRSDSVSMVHGDTGAARHAALHCTGQTAPLSLHQLDSITLHPGEREQTRLTMQAGSCPGADSQWTIPADTVLDLRQMGAVTAGTLKGGGTIELDVTGSLTVSGEMTGRTTLAIGAPGPEGELPEGPYLVAERAQEESFILLPAAVSTDTKSLRLTVWADRHTL